MKRCVTAALCLLFLTLCSLSYADVRFERHDSSIDVMINGSLAASYKHGEELAKPVLFPVYTPQGIMVCRQFPFKEVDGESHDHPHHTGVFFTIDNVNGNKFWNNKAQSPKIRYVETVSVLNGDERGTLSVRHHWLGNNGAVLLEERRSMTFTPAAGSYSVDFDITLTATDTIVTFGDTKEGMFAIRVAPWLKEKGGKGVYLSSRGTTSVKDIWGRRAEWVSLSGSKEGCIAGVVIMHHPTSENFPTFWHARNYGLFSANPLGQSAFEKGTGIESPTRYDLTLKEEETAVFRFRMLIHDNPISADEIGKLYSAYSGR